MLNSLLKDLREINRPLEILNTDSPELAPYGRIVEGDFSELFPSALERVDLKGPAYIRDVEELHRFDCLDPVKSDIYKNEPVELGLCFGMNHKMNGMEYHQGSEVIIAVTDCVLILGLNTEIRDLSWDSSLARCFFLPRGRAVELYDGTMHLAPCRVTEDPFCTLIVLPDGTNTPLKDKDPADPLMFMTNKWMICHKDSPAASNGAFAGISGENIKIRLLPGS